MFHRFMLISIWIVLVINNVFADDPKETKKKNVCLNMIVKNEAHVIKRCLESVLPIIDSWVIVDTGSTDGTQACIKEFLKDLPGELYERPWKNFGYNREEALQLAKAKKPDYILFMDADDKLSFEKGFVLPELTADYYGIMARTKKTEWMLTALIKTGLDWHWHGVIHEYVACPNEVMGKSLDKVEYVYINDGARSLDIDRFQRDIRLLHEGLKEEPNNFRYMLYLGSTYCLAGGYINSLKYYKMAIDNPRGGLPEERYNARLTIGKIQNHLKYDPKEVEASFIDAYKFFPMRLEALYFLIKHWRQAGEFQQAFDVASLALLMPKQGANFVEFWISDYGILSEYALNAYLLNYYKESFTACEQILKMQDVEPGIREVTVKIYNELRGINVANVQKKIITLLESPIHTSEAALLSHSATSQQEK